MWKKSNRSNHGKDRPTKEIKLFGRKTHQSGKSAQRAQHQVSECLRRPHYALELERQIQGGNCQERGGSLCTDQGTTRSYEKERSEQAGGRSAKRRECCLGQAELKTCYWPSRIQRRWPSKAEINLESKRAGNRWWIRTQGWWAKEAPERSIGCTSIDEKRVRCWASSYFARDVGSARWDCLNQGRLSDSQRTFQQAVDSVRKLGQWPQGRCEKSCWKG